MIQFEPVINVTAHVMPVAGPIVVWLTLVFFAVLILMRLNRELRRADKVDARLEALQEQVTSLKSVLAKYDEKARAP